MAPSNLCVAVVLALCVSSAAALRPTACSTRSADFTYFRNAACYRVQSNDDTNPDIVATFNISSAFFDNAEVEFFFWNIDASADFTGTDISIAYLGTTGMPTAISTPTFITETGTATNFGSSFSIQLTGNAALDPLSFMAVEVTLSTTNPIASGGGGAAVGMVATLVPTTTSTAVEAEEGSTAAFNVRADKVLTDNLNFVLSGDFITNKFIAQEATFTFSSSDADSVAVIADSNTATTLGSTATATPSAGVFTFTDIARQMAQPTVTFTAPITAYDLATFGPFFAGVLTFDVTEYPTLNPGTTVGVETETIFRVNLPALWQTVPLPRSGAGAEATAGATSATFALAMNPASAAAVSGTAPLTSPRTFMPFADPTATLDSYFLLSPLTTAEPTYVFVKATPTGGQVNFAVSVESVPGECSSYVDCRKHGGSDNRNPSTRGAASSNDVDRLVHCALVPGAADPTTVETTCIECLSDCDCGGGQYCHKDTGACNRNGATDFYTCDAESRRYLGLCVDKDPSGDVIGEQCRTVDPLSPLQPSQPTAVNAPTTVQGLSVATSGAVSIATPNMLPLVETTAAVDIKSDAGLGFCGGARFFSADNADVHAGDASYGFGARAILWQGFCYNSVCHECLGDSNTCGGAQQCIDGALADTIVVDGTSRTFSHNTLAGTMLAVLFMIILLQCCVCCVLLQRRKYRKQDRQEAGKDQKAKTVFA